MIDQKIAELVISWRIPGLDRLLVGVTTMGNWQAVMVVWSTMAIWYWQKERRYFDRWMGSMVGVGIINLIKGLVARERPPGEMAIIEQGGFSYPSGHSYIAMAIYGWLVYWAGKKIGNKKIRGLWLGFGLAFVALLAGSRVYLGVHWVSDVLAGLAMGGMWLAIMIYQDLKEENANKLRNKDDQADNGG